MTGVQLLFLRAITDTMSSVVFLGFEHEPFDVNGRALSIECLERVVFCVGSNIPLVSRGSDPGRGGTQVTSLRASKWRCRVHQIRHFLALFFDLLDYAVHKTSADMLVEMRLTPAF